MLSGDLLAVMMNLWLLEAGNLFFISFRDKTVKIWNVKKKIVGKSTQALKNDDDARSKYGNRSQMQSRMSKTSKVESSTVEANKL